MICSFHTQVNSKSNSACAADDTKINATLHTEVYTTFYNLFNNILRYNTGAISKNREFRKCTKVFPNGWSWMLRMQWMIDHVLGRYPKAWVSSRRSCTMEISCFNKRHSIGHLGEVTFSNKVVHTSTYLFRYPHGNISREIRFARVRLARDTICHAREDALNNIQLITITTVIHQKFNNDNATTHVLSALIWRVEPCLRRMCHTKRKKNDWVLFAFISRVSRRHNMWACANACVLRCRCPVCLYDCP